MPSEQDDVIGLWRCPECEWVGYSVDGHCRQFDEHPDGPRIPLESVEYVAAEQLRGAVERADRLYEEFEMLVDACGHCRAAGRPPNEGMIEAGRAALHALRGQ